MIQRIQTIFLLGVAVLMGMTNAYYIWIEVNSDQTVMARLSSLKFNLVETSGTVSNFADDVLMREDSLWYIGAISILSVLVSIFSVLQFKNRLNQMKLGALNSLLMVIVIGISTYKIYQYEGLLEGQGSPQLGLYLPMGAMLLNMMANRFIRKDEKLVKSVDRIR